MLDIVSFVAGLLLGGAVVFALIAQRVGTILRSSEG